MAETTGEPLKIVVASGKGGTGKTTVALNMALTFEGGLSFIDCDVEAPNAHLFFKNCERYKNRGYGAGDDFFDDIEKFHVAIPEFNGSLCNGCGKCKAVCKFNAITIMLGNPLFFPELCHSCEACFKVCPTGAIGVSKKYTGDIRRKKIDAINLTDGILNVSESKSPPLIKDIKKRFNKEGLTIIDAPPGTSCPVVAAVYGADYAVLVAEPTPFGLSDLKLAIETLRQLKVRFGVVINKFDGDFGGIKSYCEIENIDIIGIVPFNLKIAEIYSHGGFILDEMPETRDIFSNILKKAIGEAVK
ncbi:MAG TPA: ATP-binding protein [Candidatus Wallbacteria bacterium]|nr:ATP-binding protein [Candidatus Wallbacteria bacterium]